MKILQINKFLYPKGGAETYMFQLSNALAEEEIDIEFWGMQDDRNTINDTYGSFAKHIDYQQTGFFNNSSNALKTIYSVENRKQIALILDRFKPDLVHLHNFNFQLTPSILPEIKKRGIKIVQTVHDSQLICPYHRLYNFQRDTTCTKCVTGSFYNCINDKCFDGSFFKSVIGAVESYYYHSQKYYQRYIDRFIFPSKFLAGLVTKIFKDKPFNIIPNFTEKLTGVDFEKGNYYLYYGRISKEKGILDLIDIFKELHLKLVIIGKGEQEEQLTKELERIENITFLGPKSGRELFSFVGGAKYVIQPSKGFENCPMTVIESFTYGTPVIAANHSGFKDLVDHGKTGYLLNFKDLKEVKDQLLEIDQLKTDHLKDNISSFYQENLIKEKHISRILEIYRQVLEE